jgi:hypothetical protein
VDTATVRLISGAIIVIGLAGLIYARNKPSTWIPPRWQRWIAWRHQLTRDAYRYGAAIAVLAGLAGIVVTFVIPD